MYYCAACLSSDRRLLSLGELRQVIPVVKLLNLNLSLEDAICWECEAIFYRIKAFKTQVLHALKVMQMSHKTQTKKKIKSLSKLSIISKDSYDKTFSTDSLKKEPSIEENFSDCDLEVNFVEDWDGFEEEENEQVLEEDGKSAVINDDIEVETKVDPDQQIDAQPLGYKVEPYIKLSRLESQFIVSRMTLDEVYKARDSDRNGRVYRQCMRRCRTCVLGYYREVDYTRHMKKKHDVGLEKKRAHTCPICETRFTRKDSLESHYDKHFRRYKCRTCDYSHHKLANLLAHTANSHGAPNQYTCDVCNQEFDRLRSLRYHKLQHKERPRCDICGKTTSTKHNLKIHMTIHTGVKRVQCPDCGLNVRQTSLNTHRRSHSNLHDEAAYCAPCGLQFASRALYRRHLARSRAHAPPTVRRFECTQCDARFVDKSTLERHVTTKHLKILPFKCNICSRGFIRKDRLRNHILERHEGISQPKDKLCVYCGKGFKDGVSLRRHVRTHTGERPYACALCPATFAQSSTLAAHARALHKGEKGA